MSSEDVIDGSIFLRLKEERKRIGLSQAEAAARADVARETWSRYEAGALPPGLAALTAIATAGADIQYIVTGQRSAQALSQDEQELVALWRAAPLAGKAAAHAALTAGVVAPPKSKTKQVVHGSVGQSATGDVINQKGVKIDVGTKAGGLRKR